MTSGAIAAMLSTILYGRRFFPYYVYNIIGGLDEEGKYFNAHRINSIWDCVTFLCIKFGFWNKMKSCILIFRLLYTQ